MSLRLSEIPEHDATHLGIGLRQTLLRFHDALIDALRKGDITAGGGAWPTTFGTWLALRNAHAAEAGTRHRWKTTTAILPSWNAGAPRLIRAARRGKRSSTPRHSSRQLPNYKWLNVTVAKSPNFRRWFFLDVYALSQHALALPPIERTLLRQLSEGAKLGGFGVELGDDDAGQYVGLVRRRMPIAGTDQG